MRTHAGAVLVLAGLLISTLHAVTLPRRRAS